ncbi:3-dehydroquinate dehydratase [Paenibacillus sp. ACRRX]|uniref:3-dehydroquinate dehydratase n=1 Tax=unclassified Paenibacillus TaxID=185978 RepID=UPI001EF63F65|nr:MULTISPECIES: 3-dehydroquinate dehydratase [unclassified Paenibacillus]MCG7406699.1 3-dehydroquinate dehydratase [Paenibacillus sp. ACRRX]MDK8179717.1 3-dehydroquinate dehydratase [Paenibacillus sp. UMB4589-SE434]
MKTVYIDFQDRKIPVFCTTVSHKNTFSLLKDALNRKLNSGKRAIKTCLETLISIEIVGSEAILHSRRENDTLALSLY